MKTWYVFYRSAGIWSRFTDVRAESSKDAISRCYLRLEKVSGGSGMYRAFTQNKLPWDKNN